MANRIQPRRTNGQYQRATLGNTFGLDAPICPHCGAFNPYKVGIEPKPLTCHDCGKQLAQSENERDQ